MQERKRMWIGLGQGGLGLRWVLKENEVGRNMKGMDF